MATRPNLTPTRSGFTGGSYESMKCIDLFNSQELDALAGQYIKNNRSSDTWLPADWSFRVRNIDGCQVLT
jgi:hypothetical protein